MDLKENAEQNRKLFLHCTILTLYTVVIFFNGIIHGQFMVKADEAPISSSVSEVGSIEYPVETTTTTPTTTTSAKPVTTTTTVKDLGMSRADIELIALVTMAEAEGESEYGKRLVIDTVLNRVDSNSFPNTVREVIYQPSQFTSVWNGRMNRCYVRDDICKLVEEELESRSNSDCIFFRTTRYSDYGYPMFREGNHYFSSY